MHFMNCWTRNYENHKKKCLLCFQTSKQRHIFVLKLTECCNILKHYVGQKNMEQWQHISSACMFSQTNTKDYICVSFAIVAKFSLKMAVIIHAVGLCRIEWESHRLESTQLLIWAFSSPLLFCLLSRGVIFTMATLSHSVNLYNLFAII